MSARTTRRGFVGGGVALAAGVGVAKLPDLIGRTRHSLVFDVDQQVAAGAAPPFGTLLPVSRTSEPAVVARLRERGSQRVAGHLTSTSIASSEGMLQVHTLELHDGTVVALGPDTSSVFPIASGTHAYAGARGRVTFQGAATAAPSLDVDFEL
jgi:hypothetical protein